MLYHHGQGNYAVAASEAAKAAREKLEGLIQRGQARALAVVEKVQAEVPVDRIVNSRVMNFARMVGERSRISLGWNGDPAIPLHDHALQQVAERAELPWRFAQELRGQGEWGADLLAHNLNEIVRRQDRRLLVRSVNDEARGILTAKFRRLDNRPILDAFVGACQKIGAVPVDGYALETKVAFKALLPMVFEPVPNEIMAFGLMLGNSDFGDGALSLRVFMLRLWCTNYGIMDEALRQVHLGRELDDNFDFSERTYQLDSERSASMVKDIVGGELEPARINQVMDVIRRADEEKVEPSRIKEFLKKHVIKGDAEKIVEAFNGADVVNLPPGNTSWRFSNAISWIAGQEENEHKRLDLMKVAALALPNGGALHAGRN